MAAYATAVSSGAVSALLLTPGILLRLATRKSAFRNRRAAQQLRQGAFLALQRQIAEATTIALFQVKAGGLDAERRQRDPTTAASSTSFSAIYTASAQS
jgi:hypothetical protein